MQQDITIIHDYLQQNIWFLNAILNSMLNTQVDILQQKFRCRQVVPSNSLKYLEFCHWTNKTLSNR